MDVARGGGGEIREKAGANSAEQKVNIGTHVSVVEGVRQLDSVARRGVEVDLVLRDELGAVKVVLLRNESLGLDEDVGVRVGDPGTNFA